MGLKMSKCGLSSFNLFSALTWSARCPRSHPKRRSIATPALDPNAPARCWLAGECASASATAPAPSASASHLSSGMLSSTTILDRAVHLHDLHHLTCGDKCSPTAAAGEPCRAECSRTTQERHHQQTAELEEQSVLAHIQQHLHLQAGHQARLLHTQSCSHQYHKPAKQAFQKNQRCAEDPELFHDEQDHHL